MAVPGSSNARSSLIVQLSPTKSAKLSFTVQIILTLFWLAWAVMLLVTDDSGQNYLYYVFFGLALIFFTYVVLQNTSIFGVQSYIEVTPQYIVQKYGVFRTKHIIAIPDIKSVHVSPYALRVTQKDDSKVYLDLKQVRKKRDLEKIKNKVKDIAAVNGFALSESTANRP
ncbi:hypothetical protein ABID22_001344 [Pontibacter aydingkolensis]|uniref:DUF304 domain-containing protein n=1 Tax=Pontibacter aydingkolensis TaxID=1911536 RepID=A0ABS7CNT8_9BACT|nr:hypothetical protein [Pontibacter aydingkolensis]MBW7465510.1 hypothetical protein [Pontibacter aydingkolensis]